MKPATKRIATYMFGSLPLVSASMPVQSQLGLVVGLVSGRVWVWVLSSSDPSRVHEHEGSEECGPAGEEAVTSSTRVGVGVRIRVRIRVRVVVRVSV